MLKDLECRQAKPRDRAYKLADSGGLFLHIAPSGRRTWRFRFWIEGKEQLLVLGTYPDVGLTRARDLRDGARGEIRAGGDPRRKSEVPKEADPSLTFEAFARRWHALQKSRWRPVHADDVLHSMERDLFPAIGHLDINAVEEPALLAALRKVEERGAIETAHRLRQRAERVFRFARASGSKNDNPAAVVREALARQPKKRRWPAIVDIEELRRFVALIDGAGASPVTRLASRFLALTAQRPGMVRGAAWQEMQGIDWEGSRGGEDDARWVVPAERMKQEMDLREDEAFDHVIPLAPAAVEVLRTVRALTGGGPLIFPSTTDAASPISENAIGYLYNREGYKGRHVPHGWRSSFSTIMNERVERRHPGEDRLIIDRLIIDLMLAHRPSGMSSAEFRYNRSAYMPRRREIACDWAALLLEGAAPASRLLEGRRRRRA
ncbi:DUF4102 domain-containing protein [Sphingomonas parva]|uniref:DUF4102 domain-containing protein n=1 Tax=Sphingomonas parva TaxID=2555898 RepID=A0A4Y8ZWH2_9SPHN|nr:integrase arm-type DNA-binding domain-containing protein [Sphingomonas parva]TFI59817.1 DUF4102 domain-containing protein [Sphingomonas parva]